MTLASLLKAALKIVEENSYDTVVDVQWACIIASDSNGGATQDQIMFIRDKICDRKGIDNIV